MKDGVTDPKHQVILEAAWQCFANYGFRKTSMDDIAQGAGMSRPALYLRFRNKEDIFRSLVEAYYNTAVDAVSAALEADGSVTEVLTNAFERQAGDAMKAMLSSPHGMELMDAGSAAASDLFEAGEVRLRQLYADWLTKQANAGRIDLCGPAEDVATTVTIALKGMKYGTPEFELYQHRIRQLAKLVGDGLAAR